MIDVARLRFNPTRHTATIFTDQNILIKFQRLFNNTSDVLEHKWRASLKLGT